MTPMLNSIVLGIGASSLRAGTPAVINKCVNPGEIAYTFGGGPIPWNGREFAKNFATYNGSMTTFVNGYNGDCIYNEVNVVALQERFAQGHLIGSMSWSHPHLSQLTSARIELELIWMEEALVKILGVVPKYFRLPYGDGWEDQRVLDLLHARGYVVIGSSIDSGDTRLPIGPVNGEAVATIVERSLIRAEYPEPHIILAHEFRDETVAALPLILSGLVAKGYKLVTVAECLNDQNPYLGVKQDPTARDESWTCDEQKLLNPVAASPSDPTE